MGGLIAKLLNPKKEMMVGLDAAGKTTRCKLKHTNNWI